MDFTHRCRGCLSNDEDTLHPLEDSPTIQLFQDCVNLKLSAGPGLPRNICETCYGKCLSWKKFKLQCLETDVLLNFKLGYPKPTKDDIEISANELGTHTKENKSSPEHETIEQEEHTVLRREDIEDCTSATHDSTGQELSQEIDIVYNNVKEEVLDGFCISGDDQILETDIQEAGNREYSIAENDSVQAKIKKRSDYSCNKCKMQFRSIIRFEAHQRQHQGLKPEVCKVCNAEFNSTKARWRHMQKHVDTKKYVCKDCGKCYKFGTSLTMHRRSHRNPDHVCEICDKSFFRAHDLRRHLLAHTIETPFECDKCPKRFKHALMLRRHVSRIHEGKRTSNCL